MKDYKTLTREKIDAEPDLKAVCTDCGLRGATDIGLVDIEKEEAK